MGITGPYEKLTKHLPTGSLVSVGVLVSVLGSVVIQLSFDLVIYFWLCSEKWYTPYQFSTTNLISYEGTVLFLFTSIQYLVTSIAFSRAKPFRNPLYKNPYFTVSLVVLVLYSYYIIVYPDMGSIKTFGLKTEKDDKTGKEHNALPLNFRLYMAALTLVNGVVTYFYEKVFVWWVQQAWKRRKERISQTKIDAEHRRDMEMVAAEMSNNASPLLSGKKGLNYSQTTMDR